MRRLCISVGLFMLSCMFLVPEASPQDSKSPAVKTDAKSANSAEGKKSAVKTDDPGKTPEPMKSPAGAKPEGGKPVAPPPPPKPVVNRLRLGFPAAKYDPDDITKSDAAWEIDWEITNPDNGMRRGFLGGFGFGDKKFGDKKDSDPAKKGGFPGFKMPPQSGSSVLAIRSARYMFKDASGKPRWVTMVKNLELGEILVPYDRMKPVFMDVSEFNFRLVPAKKEYLGPSCVLPGEILGSDDPRMKDKVHKEVHDDGLRWLSQDGKSRRGEKMQLWSIFEGGNYRYLIEYGFSDDGVIIVRLGATAHNYFPKQKDQRDIHLHVGCWRFDPEIAEDGTPNIGGAAQNQVMILKRQPRDPVPNGMFKLTATPFNVNDEGKATEGFADWNAEEFTTLRVQSTVRKNGSKNPQFTALDVLPQRVGAVRNYPWKYHYANHDFWVTHRKFGPRKYGEVPLFAGQSMPLEKNAVTVWHNSPSIHVPRGEDYGADGQSNYEGAAVTTWVGFLIRPVNLHDHTPFFPQKGSAASKLKKNAEPEKK